MKPLLFALGLVLALSMFFVSDLRADTIVINWGLTEPPDPDRPISAPDATIVGFDGLQFTSFIVNWNGLAFDFTALLNQNDPLALWLTLLVGLLEPVRGWGFLPPPALDTGSAFVTFGISITHSGSTEYSIPLAIGERGLLSPPIGNYGTYSVSVPEPSSLLQLLMGVSVLSLGVIVRGYRS